MNQLEQLKQRTVIVADSGDIDSITRYQPEDATTNPSLIYKAAQLPQYQKLVEDAVATVKSRASGEVQPCAIADYLAVSIGALILKSIPGRISTEVDARLSYDSEASINKARQLMALYEEKGVGKDRVLIKLAATWQGIRAASVLEKEGIQCNLTLLFSFAQARACADAGVFLISPFVGRIYDWYKKNQPDTLFTAENDPGVASVRNIFQFYKQHGYPTVVMGASFRTPEQVLALNGCDRLTVSPQLLAKLKENDAPVPAPLAYHGDVQPKPAALSEAEFFWQHNQDAMAVEKLAEGIRLFAADQNSLEALLKAYL
ncbi:MULTISPECIES: transaldolase [Atlantibacter]|uniref:transaldolase n=1 Tax=Atlantibacter TaxID=1903434 RepID=UPI00193376CE|nr:MULTISPECIES: transaldolase [Atlantibacter]MBL7637579.1 transaldolase [Atlantibacter hermannii]MBL7676057.1 transaldolase [Atlantibacter hermannii]MCZ7835657.1 transaldolase [Atlantibacter hermannii]